MKCETKYIFCLTLKNSKIMTTVKRLTRTVTGTVTYLRRPKVIHFDEEKPTVYGMQAVRGGVIKGEAVISYAANAAHVPATTIQMAKNALFDAIHYFCLQGHRVEVPGLGSFAIKTRCKVTRTEEECDTSTIKNHGRVLMFWAAGEVRDMLFSNGLGFEENKSLTNMACGAMDGVDANNNTYLVNAEGKYLVAQIGGEGAFKRFKKNGNVYELVAGSGTGSKKGADEVAVVGSLTDEDDGVFTVGNIHYTLNSGALIPAANVYGSLVPEP